MNKNYYLSALLAVALVGCKSSQSTQSSSHTSKTEINYSLNIGEKTLLLKFAKFKIIG